jgi:8-oxo-dGTP pyrophosphatase MutT (NUDIX family)
MKTNDSILIAGTILFLGDGKVVLQRRDTETKVCPEMLNPFGGHTEDGEEPLATARRELAEETSLDISKLLFNELFTIYVPKNNLTPDNETVTVFRVDIENLNFKVFEGEGAEAHEVNSLVARDDLTPAMRAIVDRLLKEGY